jgi:squalene-hopene/tetraprenyl-beta-curcumene cyclase
LDQAIDRGRQCLLNRQQEEGCWCGALDGGVNPASEYILLLAWLGQLDRPVARQVARHIVSQQRSQGGWALFPGGEVDISASVKAYFALTLTGHDSRSEPMRLGREAIIAHGGADSVNHLTRFFLALLGQIPYDCCPAIPPEMILLPKWSPISIDRLSAWSRAVLVPLSIIWAHRPARMLAKHQGIGDLFVRPVAQWPNRRCRGCTTAERPRGWQWTIHLLDHALKSAERWRIRPLRRCALRAAEQWTKDRFVDSDGLGAMFSPTLWSLVALKCLGYSDESPGIRYCHEQLESLALKENDTVRLQPCKSPVWDTAMTLRALSATAHGADEGAAMRATSWLMAREVVRPGDWATYVRAQPTGWFFEYHNAFYPDLIDTATVLAALREQLVTERDPMDDTPQRIVIQTKAASIAEARGRASQVDLAMGACGRARRWIFAMQNADGGWGAFDKDHGRRLLRHVSRASHDALIDPSTPDTTGRVLEALALWGATWGDPAMDRAVRYLRAEQQRDGSWRGRWGVNYICGTWQCLVGLTGIGMARDDTCVERGAQWLLGHQQTCGGWGESPASYANPQLRGQGDATPSQTSWALLGLIACGLHDHPAVDRGVDYLVQHQRPDGSWHEPEFTGTGLPGVLYLRYHMYPFYFPLLALGRYRQARRRGGQAGGGAART